VDEAHVFARDADELVVFRFEWANVQEAVFGEFVERDQPLAVSFFALWGAWALSWWLVNLWLMLMPVGLFLAPRLFCSGTASP